MNVHKFNAILEKGKSKVFENFRVRNDRATQIQEWNKGFVRVTTSGEQTRNTFLGDEKKKPQQDDKVSIDVAVALQAILIKEGKRLIQIQIYRFRKKS